MHFTSIFSLHLSSSYSTVFCRNFSNKIQQGSGGSGLVVMARDSCLVVTGSNNSVPYTGLTFFTLILLQKMLCLFVEKQTKIYNKRGREQTKIYIRKRIKQWTHQKTNKAVNVTENASVNESENALVNESVNVTENALNQKSIMTNAFHSKEVDGIHGTKIWWRTVRS